MTTKITLVLSMALNVVLSLAVLQNYKRPVSLGDFRDAVADSNTAAQPAEAVQAVPAELTPPPAPETVVTDAAPAAAPAEIAAEAVVEESPRPQAIVIANDWASYRQEMAEDKDVLVSNIFRSETNAERAMNAAVQRLYAAGKDVLFSCLMPATGGGVFYLIRLAPAEQDIPRITTSMDDMTGKDFVKEVQFITDKTEKEVWGFI